jgi:hypothetical protein
VWFLYYTDYNIYIIYNIIYIINYNNTTTHTLGNAQTLKYSHIIDNYSVLKRNELSNHKMTCLTEKPTNCIIPTTWYYRKGKTMEIVTTEGRRQQGRMGISQMIFRTVKQLWMIL